jgi:hypothetical protein
MRWGTACWNFGGTDAANEALKQFRESLIRNRDQQKARFQAFFISAANMRKPKIC